MRFVSFFAWSIAVCHGFVGTSHLSHAAQRSHGPKNSNTSMNSLKSDTSSSNDDVSAATYSETETTLCPVLGKISRIRIPGQQNDVLSTLQVPTFKAEIDANDGTTGSNNADLWHQQESTQFRGLEGALNHGPAFVVDGVLSKNVCKSLIDTFESVGFENYTSGKNHHGALQMLVDPKTVDLLVQRLGRHIDIKSLEERRIEMLLGQKETHTVRLVLSGLNRRWRAYRYAPDSTESFAPHIDAGFHPSGLSEDGMELVLDASKKYNDDDIVSRLTVLFYLNDDFEGGTTNFYSPKSRSRDNGSDLTLIASVQPKTGSCLVFPQGVGEAAVEHAREHWPLHEGAPVRAGSSSSKYVIRSDILFYTQRHKLPNSEDTLVLYDEHVRQTFLPQSPVWNAKYLSLVESLYNPHMGVENLGPLLYSFVRFTKSRRIVEIGSGYTSPWILQALKDNDDDLERIRKLQIAGHCRLKDWPWAVPEFIDRYDSDQASLLAVDNCLHKEETASGAVAVSKYLGLSKYMDFMLGDAFDLELDEGSVDILWCDFAVGSRMIDFARSSWPSIKEGGFLLCHSTLTNRRTRTWLEAVRINASIERTGIPAGECVELSLLEPHKHYQNSITVLQKRKKFAEPLYSEYA